MDQNKTKHTGIALLIVAISIATSLLYYFVIRPVHRDNELGRCLERAESKRYRTTKQEYRDNCFKQF